ncbi:response regulator [Sphingobium sp. CFD-2]|uniref:response regulator n=1 Tax=Sphingobium sp. CFD-2 TaxID=2878542 RepID=UPI00214B9957|nr:response regulator [Sphingobium sp. CFD-2]
MEDEIFVGMTACQFLTDQDFTVFDAQDGDEAILLLEQLDGKVDLLFTDVYMPGRRDGLALVREVQARWPAIKILITSGGMGPDALPPDLQKFGPVLQKPYSLPMLVLTIWKAVFPPSVPWRLPPA